jgi:hypothetical protein
VRDVFGKFNEAVLKPSSQQFGAASPTSPSASTGDDTPPKSFPHALARASQQSAVLLGDQEPLGRVNSALRPLSLYML